MAGLQDLPVISKGSVVPGFLKGKVVGVYYSAHWCPPCRQFTPQLAYWYKHFKETSPHADEFEIVFASSDQSEADFDQYFASMPWTAIPFSERNVAQSMMTKHGVMGIPSLVIVGPDGKTITSNGRSIVSQDPNGADFPWSAEKYAGGFPVGAGGLLKLIAVAALVILIGRLAGLF